MRVKTSWMAKEIRSDDVNLASARLWWK